MVDQLEANHKVGTVYISSHNSNDINA